MSSQPVVKTVLVLVLSAACVWGSSGAAAPPTESGEPEGWTGTPRSGPAAVAPEGFDDMLNPLSMPAGPLTVRPATHDATEPDPCAGTAVPLWERLEQIGTGLRSSARIEFEPGGDTAPALLAQARQIADLWNGGDCDQAIALLHVLEDSGARLAMGIDWSSAKAPGGLREGGLDVRIGTRSGARGLALDFSRQSGSIFALVQWGTLAAESYWSVHRSTDHGDTWVMTYEFYSTVGIVDVDAGTVDDYLYIGYLVGNAQDQFRMRRCTVGNGAIDGAYGFHVALTAGAGSVFTEVAVATNSDDFQNRIYGVAITDPDTLKFVWDVASDGTSFEDDSPPTSNPAHGLDAVWAPHYATGDPFIFVSYEGTDGHIHVQRHSTGVWDDRIVCTSVGTAKETSISAFERTVICAYEIDLATGQGVQYMISYTAGELGSWAWSGNFAEPDGVEVTAYGDPSVDARTGNGTAIIYWGETGDPDPMYFRCRHGYAVGPWDNESAFNDVDVRTQVASALAPLSYEPEYFDHGALYIGSGLIALFDRPFSLESGVAETTSGSLRLLPSFPNPCQDQVEIRFALAEPGHVSLQLFDVLGRRVAVLLDRPLGAGSHVVPLGGQGLGSGAYYYRLSSGTQQLEGRLTQVR